MTRAERKQQKRRNQVLKAKRAYRQRQREKKAPPAATGTSTAPARSPFATNADAIAEWERQRHGGEGGVVDLRTWDPAFETLADFLRELKKPPTAVPVAPTVKQPPTTMTLPEPDDDSGGIGVRPLKPRAIRGND